MEEKYCIQCGRKHYGEGQFCEKHSSQINTFGKCLDSNPRNNQDRNRFEIVDDYIKVHLYSFPSCNINKVFLIDSQDIQLVLNYRFIFRRNTVMVITESGMYPLANMILGVKLGTSIVYKSGNNLDFCRDNLVVKTTKKESTIKDPNMRYFASQGIYKNKYGRYYAEYSIFDKRYVSHLVRTKEEALFARYILEQMFSPLPIPPYDNHRFTILTTEQKEAIISKLKNHYNK